MCLLSHKKPDLYMGYYPPLMDFKELFSVDSHIRRHNLDMAIQVERKTEPP
jgi:hypothetical protein